MKANHPIWKTINIAVLLGGVGFILWLNASQFDATEWKAIGEIALLLIGKSGFEAITQKGEV